MLMGHNIVSFFDSTKSYQSNKGNIAGDGATLKSVIRRGYRDSCSTATILVSGIFLALIYLHVFI